MKWSLHAREEIVFELLVHLRGNTTRGLLEGMRKSTREMIEEQEAVRGRLFTIQDVMQSTVRAWLQVHICLSRQPKILLSSSLNHHVIEILFDFAHPNSCNVLLHKNEVMLIPCCF